MADMQTRLICSVAVLGGVLACGAPTETERTEEGTEAAPALDTPLVIASPSLTLGAARVAIAAASAEAARRGTTGTIAVTDTGGHLVALHRVDGTFPAGDEVSIGKARTAALFRKPTRIFEQIIVDGRITMLNIPGFMPMRGGVPIELDGHVVGAIGVSGASSAQEDEELAIAGANALMEEPFSATLAADSVAPEQAAAAAPDAAADVRVLPGSVLGVAGARALIAGAVAEARRRDATGTIAVTDAGGHLVALERIDGTFAFGHVVSAGKARTASLFRKRTAVFEEIITGGRTPMLNVPDFTPMRGGVPIVIAGRLVGGIGVSGAGSAAEDEIIAVAGARILMGDSVDR